MSDTLGRCRKALRPLAAVLVAGAVTAGPTVAGVSAQQRPLLVAIYKSGTQQYFIDQAKGFKQKAAQLGADAKTVNVELDANLAINEVNNALTSGAIRYRDHGPRPEDRSRGHSGGQECQRPAGGHGRQYQGCFWG